MAVKKRSSNEPETRPGGPGKPSPPDEPLTRRFLEDLLFGTGRVRRFTQDSPVLPDVWLDYAGVAGDEDEGLHARASAFPYPAVKLLLTPFRENAAGDVRTMLVDRLELMKGRTDISARFGHKPGYPRVAYNLTTIAATPVLRGARAGGPPDDRLVGPPLRGVRARSPSQPPARHGAHRRCSRSGARRVVGGGAAHGRGQLETRATDRTPGNRTAP